MFFQGATSISESRVGNHQAVISGSSESHLAFKMSRENLFFNLTNSLPQVL